MYAGVDPLTGRRHDLREVIPAGPKAAAEADKPVRRLASQVDEQRHPRTNATVDQLLDRYLAMLDVGRTTHRMYTKYLEKHVRRCRVIANIFDVRDLQGHWSHGRWSSGRAGSVRATRQRTMPCCGRTRSLSQWRYR